MFQNPETQKIWPHFVFCVPLEKGLTKNENKKGGQNWFCVDYRKQPHSAATREFSEAPAVSMQREVGEETCTWGKTCS